MSIAKEGLGIISVLGIAAFLCILTTFWRPHPLLVGSGVVLGILFLSTLYFFRDPERIPPAGKNVILAPADGVVLSVKPVFEHEFLNEDANEVAIFLSIFDVHINRVPISGMVELFRYQPGGFRAAFSESAVKNEQTIIGISNGKLKILVRQIAGLVARRIVCNVSPGMTVERGARFGLIKFGSRTDLVMPTRVKVCVSPRQKVRGGETIIGTYEDYE